MKTGKVKYKEAFHLLNFNKVGIRKKGIKITTNIKVSEVTTNIATKFRSSRSQLIDSMFK